jgi:hypothetical protein
LPATPAATVAAMQTDAVTDVVREAAELAIVPRLRALADGDATEKSAGEVVAVADREAEDLPACSTPRTTGAGGWRGRCCCSRERVR